jgi:hypothetical protein
MVITNLNPNTNYGLSVVALNSAGSAGSVLSGASNPIFITTLSGGRMITENQSTLDEPVISDPDPILYQSFPNPAKDGATTLRYYLPLNSRPASMRIYGIDGKLVADFPITKEDSGEIVLGTGRLVPGVYLYMLEVDGKRIETKRMIVD